MDAYTYSELPEKTIVPTSEWEKAVESHLVKHGVQWVNPRKVEEKTTEEAPEGSNKRRKRTVNYVWYQTFNCHKFGNYRDKIAEGSRVKGGASNQARDLQKASKKTDCKAKLKVTCYKESPDVVRIVHLGTHNHVLGSSDDLRHLPLSKDRRAVIMERLRKGYSKRDCRIAIQNDFRKYIANEGLLSDNSGNNLPVLHRDQVVHADEIYNMYKKIQESSYKKDVDEKKSVKLWLEELETKGHSTFVHTTYENDFTFVLSSPWQKQLLLNSTMICLGATHCVSHIQRGIMYTIVVRHPLTGTGCPVAYMFTEDHSMAPITVSLSFIKNKIGLLNIKKNTIDVSATEHAAISAVYPEATIQWCLFHVARAWMGKIKELIKLESTAMSQQVHRQVIADMKKLMWEKDQQTFLLSLVLYNIKYGEYTSFIAYVDRHYLNREKFVHWSAVFQPQIFSNMETNNYIES